MKNLQAVSRKSHQIVTTGLTMIISTTANSRSLLPQLKPDKVKEKIARRHEQEKNGHILEWID